MLHIEIKICRKLMYTDEMQEFTKIHKDEIKIGQDAHQISGYAISLCYTSAIKGSGKYSVAVQVKH